MPNANTNTGWSSTKVLSAATTEIQLIAVGINVVRVYSDSSTSGNINYQWSNDEGTTWGTPVVVDSTSGDNDVMLNTNLAYDQITGRLHFLYGRNVDLAGSAAVLCHRYTDNPFNASPSFSSEHILDSGTGYTNTNGRFYRVAQSAYNGSGGGRVVVHYATEDVTTFSTDTHMWRVTSSDGGQSWSSPTSVFTTGNVTFYEPNCCTGSDGTMVLSWYDDGSNTNGGGDIYTAISYDQGVTWPSTGTKRTTTTNYGRPRPACDAGRIWIIANRPWPVGSGSDVYSFHSLDNGLTFSAPVLRGTHVGSGNTSHPDVIVVNTFVGMIWGDSGTNPGTRQFIYSSDGGTSFSGASNVLTVSTGANLDAPRLLATTNRLLAVGYDDTVPNMVWASNPFFGLLPKAQTSLIDDFSGFTAGNLLNSGNYTVTNLGGEPLKATGSSSITRNTAAGGFSRAGSYRNTTTYTGNVEIWLTISTLSGGGETDIFIWDPVAKSGYSVIAASGDFATKTAVEKYATGTPSDLALESGVQPVAGQINSLQIIGNYVIGWKFISSVWYEVNGARTLDSTYRSSLKHEIEIAGLTSTGHTDTQYGGGTVVVPSASVAPVASGTIGVGQVLSATDGTWAGAPSRYTYQWQSAPDGITWTNITFATIPLYTVADASKAYRVLVTGTNTVGAGTASPSNSLGAGASIAWIGAAG